MPSLESRSKPELTPSNSTHTPGGQELLRNSDDLPRAPSMMDVHEEPKTVRPGSVGDAVKEMQQLLRHKGYDLALDGSFGTQTKAAVVDFQKRNGLSPDGVVGTQTWKALQAINKEVTTQPAKSAPSIGEPFNAIGYQKGQQIPFKAVVLTLEEKKVLTAEQTAKQFVAMYEAAQKDGIKLSINSAYRGMAEQEQLWANHQAGKGPLAARPGYSNHQSGIALDLQTGGLGTPTYEWLKKNAGNYGFFRTVPSEPWHWECRGAMKK